MLKWFSTFNIALFSLPIYSLRFFCFTSPFALFVFSLSPLPLLSSPSFPFLPWATRYPSKAEPMEHHLYLSHGWSGPRGCGRGQRGVGGSGDERC